MYDDDKLAAARTVVAGAASAPARGPAKTTKTKTKRRRLSALGLPKGYKGWIHDAVSNGYFWVQARRNRKPLGPFFVHPTYAPAGGAGEEAVGTGRGVKWDLVPTKAMGAAIADGAKRGDVPDPVAAESQPGSCVVVLDPQSGHLVAINFHKPPPGDLEERLRRKARALAPLASMLSKSKLRTQAPKADGPGVAWGEGEEGSAMAEDAAIVVRDRASPQAAAEVRSRSRGRNMEPAPRPADDGDVGTRTAIVPFSSSGFGSSATVGAATPTSVAISRVSNPHMVRSATEPLSAPDAHGPAAADDRKQRRKVKRRASIFDDPAKLRKAMALQMMSGRVSGADEQLRQLVNAVRDEPLSDSQSDADSRDDASGDDEDEVPSLEDDDARGDAGFAVAGDASDSDDDHGKDAKLAGGRCADQATAGTYWRDAKTVPSTDRAATAGGGHAAAPGIAPGHGAAAARGQAPATSGVPKLGQGGILGTRTQPEVGLVPSSVSASAGPAKSGATAGSGIVNAATSVFKTLLEPPAGRRAVASEGLRNEVRNVATDAAKKHNLFADMDASSMELRMDSIPERFRGNARLYLPFRYKFRAHGYAMLLLRRGIATLIFVLLSQNPPVKQAVLFLYFVGWLLWQVASSPFQDSSDNWFATLTLAVIVATAGLELHFLSLVVGPLWVTWTQLILLALPISYMLADIGGEMIDMFDERGLLPTKCSVGPDYINASARMRHGRRALLCTMFCVDICCPVRCRRSLRRRCWCVCACCRVISCEGKCFCCCRSCCRILLEPVSEDADDGRKTQHDEAKRQALMDSASNAVRAARRSVGGAPARPVQARIAGHAPVSAKPAASAAARVEPAPAPAAASSLGPNRSALRAVTLAKRRKHRPHTKNTVTLGPETSVISPGGAKLPVAPSHKPSHRKPPAPAVRSRNHRSGSKGKEDETRVTTLAKAKSPRSKDRQTRGLKGGHSLSHQRSAGKA